MLSTNNGGRTWTLLPSATKSSLYAVYAVSGPAIPNGTMVIAVGANSTILISRGANAPFVPVVGVPSLPGGIALRDIEIVDL